MSEFGTLARQARIDRRISLHDLATLLGGSVTPSLVTSVEVGRMPVPPELVIRWMGALTDDDVFAEWGAAAARDAQNYRGFIITPTMAFWDGRDKDGNDAGGYGPVRSIRGLWAGDEMPEGSTGPYATYEEAKAALG